MTTPITVQTQKARTSATRARVAWLVLAVAAIIGSMAHRATKIDHSFFGDEVWVISDVREGRYVPHAIPQPPLFFYSEVLASRLCGFGEACLRVPAQVFAVLLTLVPLLMLRRSTLLTPEGAAIWCALLGFCSVVVFYSGRTKQYTLEALAAAVLIWLFSRAIEDPKGWWPFAGVGAVIVLSLHSPVFILLATGMAGFVAARDWRTRWRIAAIHAGLAAFFVIAYFAYLKPGAAVTERFGDLYDYFRERSDLRVFWDGSIGFVVRQTALWVGQMLNLTRGFLVIAGIAVVIWLAVLVVKRQRTAMAVAFVCVAPPLFVLLASSTRVYPYSELRLMTFLAPGLMLAIALAFQWLIMSKALRWVGLAAALILTSAFVVQQVRNDPYNSTYMHVADLRPAYAFLRAQRTDDTPVLCRKFDCMPLALYVRFDAGRMVSLLAESPADVAKPFPRFWSLLDARDEELLRNAGFVPLRRFVCEDRVVTLWRNGR